MLSDRLRHELDRTVGATPPAKIARRLEPSFASRLELAVECGLVPTSNAEMIDVIREMRNACAPGRDKLTFRSPAIAEALRSLLTVGAARSTPSNPALRRDLSGRLWSTCSHFVRWAQRDILQSARTDFPAGDRRSPDMGCASVGMERPPGGS